MKRQAIIAGLGVACFILAVNAVYAKKSHSKEKSIKEYFSAAFGVAQPVNIAIRDYSTSADLQDLVRAYQQGGQKALRKAIHKTRKGYFNFAHSQTMPLLIVESSPDGATRKLTLVGQAPGWFSGSGASGVSLGHNGYPYTLIQLEVDQNGKGQGSLYEFVDLSFDKQGRMRIRTMYRFPEKLQGLHSER